MMFVYVYVDCSTNSKLTYYQFCVFNKCITALIVGVITSFHIFGLCIILLVARFSVRELEGISKYYIYSSGSTLKDIINPCSCPLRAPKPTHFVKYNLFSVYFCQSLVVMAPAPVPEF